jgi:3-deoxy-D-manno-octulosonate 8-phosphate phosphatase (KDO 8-P phosphatase)
MSDTGSCGIPGGQYPSDCEVTEGLRQRAMSRKDQDERGYAWRNCLPRAKEIKLLLLDVDGVLTDGSIVYGNSGTELKAFNIKDGFGIRLLREAGVEVGIVTARRSEAVERRAQDLKLAHLYQGVGNKIEAFAEILASQKLTPQQIAYMGDDWLDLPLLSRVGLAVTVADGVAEVKAVAHYVTRQAGGRGAVREVCELIIEAKEKREELLTRYLR